MDSQAIKSVFRDDICAGRVALVTGGGSGIGQEIAIKLAQYGAKVAVMGRREAAVQETVAILAKQGIDAMYVTGDVRSPDDAARVVDQIVKRFGKLDILINAAAGNFLSLAENLTANAFRTVLDIDAVGTFNMCRASIDALKKNPVSHIINITATLQLPATWYQVHASAAKAAVDSVTRTLALEWGTYGVRVNGIAPGPIADTTGMTKLSGDITADQINDAIVTSIPIGRMGAKTDIAATVLFLVSPAASFVTGDTLIVDGANWLYKPPIMPRATVSGWSKKLEKTIRKKPASKL